MWNLKGIRFLNQFWPPNEGKVRFWRPALCYVGMPLRCHSVPRFCCFFSISDYMSGYSSFVPLPCYFPLIFVLYLLVTHYLFSRLSSPISLVLSLSISVVFVSSVSFYIVFFLSISVIIISLFLSHFSFRSTSLPFHLSIRYLCISTCSVLSLKKLKRSLLDHHAVCPHVSPTNNF
jgi:hypothetical protein